MATQQQWEDPDRLPPTDTSSSPTPQNPQTPVPSQDQRAPSLDIMASQSTAAGGERTPLVIAVEGSRSSSSTNSPVPYDNAAESDFFMGVNDSESSLGVPNIQDVRINGSPEDDDAASEAASEDCYIAPINRLPNEILMSVFSRLSSHADLLNCVLTCKRWGRNSVDLLWHRPTCTNWKRHQSVCQTLTVPTPYFPYKDCIKRLNLANIADQVNDGSVIALAACNRIERLTLTNCKNLTDTGLMALVQHSTHLLALDISYASQITVATVSAIAHNCTRLQGLNITGCTKISNEGLIELAQNCKYIKRIKLNECTQVTDDTVFALAKHCPNMLEIDLQNCNLVTNAPITKLLAKGQALRELRLTGCELINDSAFLDLPDGRIYEQLRILDLTSCAELSDLAVERIIKVAPRLRNLVLAKCRNITDAAVISISRLGKNLHYLHLGHCANITDEGVKRLVYSCNRIRYIDLGCCTNLTDDSVTRLATLPKLKRIGLVKCSAITDESVLALAKANQRRGARREHYGPSNTHTEADGWVHPAGTVPPGGVSGGVSGGASSAGMSSSGGNSSLERVHLSYCSQLTIRSIIRLLNACNRLTHLSLTGVPAFLREDLARFCRSPPPEFTAHQREMFCVFSGEGVMKLRNRLNEHRQYDMYRDTPAQTLAPPAPPLPSLLDVLNGGLPSVMPNGHQMLPLYHVGHMQQQQHQQEFQPGMQPPPLHPPPHLYGGWAIPPGPAPPGGGNQRPGVNALDLLQSMQRTDVQPTIDQARRQLQPPSTDPAMEVPNTHVNNPFTDTLVDVTMGGANVSGSIAVNRIPPPPPPVPSMPVGGPPRSPPTDWRTAMINRDLVSGPRATPTSPVIVHTPPTFFGHYHPPPRLHMPGTLAGPSASTASAAPIRTPSAQPGTGASAASMSGASATAPPAPDNA